MLVPELMVDGKRISGDGPAYVVAEIGHNHQGDLEKAKALIHAAKECGVDAVKLQKRDNRRLYTRALYDAPYDNEHSFGATYGEHREALELSASEWLELREFSREEGVTLFATVFDEPSADFLAELGLPAFKIASADLVNTPLLRHVAGLGKPIFLSTGGGTMEDVERAVDTILPRELAARRHAVHGCVPVRRRGAPPRRDRDVSRAVPRARDRAVRPPERDRDDARRVHARRTGHREALHARSRVEGLRSRVLAHARRDAEARPRPPPRTRCDRSRRQASARERAAAAREDGEEARRGA